MKMKVHPLLKIFSLAFLSAVLAGVVVIAAMWGYFYFDARLNGISNFLTVTRVQFDLEKLRAEIVKFNSRLSDDEIQMKMDERLANAEKPVMDALRERIKGVGIRKFKVGKIENKLGFMSLQEDESCAFAITTRDNPFTSIPMEDLIRFAVENDGQNAGRHPVPLKITPAIKGSIHYELGPPFYLLTVPIVFFAVFFILLRKHLKNKVKLLTPQGIPTP